MSKKQSSLLSFFQTKQSKPQNVNKKSDGESAVKEEKITPKKKVKEEISPEKKQRVTKRVKPVQNSDEEDSPIKKKKDKTKRRRVVISSDDDSDFKMDDNHDSSSDEREDIGDEENTTPPITSKPPHTPKTKASVAKPVRTTQATSTPRASRVSANSSTPIRLDFASSFINSFTARNEQDELNVSTLSTATLDDTIYQVEEKKKKNERKMDVNEEREEVDGVQMPHLAFEFLKPSKIRDAARRRPTDPEYDPSTLFVSKEFIDQQTPGHKQWWQLKAQNFDTVLLFKVGKFYELYHMDAVVAVNNLSLAYMKGKYAHCGFPESAYGRFADQLVSRGFKVARVEQTETPQQLEARSESGGTKEKVVKRELCRLTTIGTRTFGPLDGTDDAHIEYGDSTAKLLMALKEKQIGDEWNYGICIVDTSTGKFVLGQFVDDEYRSKLRTLIANYTPAQVLLERGRLSKFATNIVDCMLPSVPKENLSTKTQFFTAEKAVLMLSNDNYLGPSTNDWPITLREMLDCDSTVAKPSDNYGETWNALGAVIYYLNRCLIDIDMITFKLFERYDPNVKKLESVLPSIDIWANRPMIVDGVALENLNIVPVDGGTDDDTSLYKQLNKCCTPFGKRLLKSWVSSPTCDPHSIISRQQTIQWLIEEGAEFGREAGKMMKELPDLERCLQKIHTIGLLHRATQHPDSRAVMFEKQKYDKRKIMDLTATLKGFEVIRKIVELYDRYRMNGDSCEMMDKLIGISEEKEEDCMPDVSNDLQHFKEAFNHKEALENGIIVPKPGMDPYDNCVDAVKKGENELESYRREQERKLECKISYWGSGKSRYQMEIPEKVDVPNNFVVSAGKKKGYTRYCSPQLRLLIDNLSMAEQERDKLRGDSTRKIFADFDSRRSKWLSICNRIAQFDVLLSLSNYAKNCGLEMCVPQFVFDSQKPFLSIENGCHPCLVNSSNQQLSIGETINSTYIANDTHLGGIHPLTLLLTGPNMGGKSTLMRQVAVLCVLAHIGSLVPARSMKLSPIDRIVTRIGANDRIMAGQSTFFVELNETRNILRDSTPHSLVVMDELGRGTSTFDGTSIASSVLSYLSNHINCRSFFSTHYHSLCERFKGDNNVKLAHMACMVENENESDPTEECVTFLYRLVDGICPKSYGFYAAKLAKINDNVIRNAYIASSRMSGCHQLESLRKAARNGVSIDELEKMVAAL